MLFLASKLAVKACIRNINPYGIRPERKKNTDGNEKCDFGFSWLCAQP
jgi:hypothetical protein